MKKKVYIAGPITGVKDYKDRFAEVEAELVALGLDPVNPTDAPEGWTYREYINAGLKKLMDCDVICCINAGSDKRERDWPPSSKGERLEWLYATTVGMPLMMATFIETREKVGWKLEIPRCWHGMFNVDEEQ